MADEYTQANRPIRVDTELGEDVLLLTAFNGLESISLPFNYELDLFSTRKDIDPADILRTGVSFAVELPDGDKRYYHGICNRFTQCGRAADLSIYRMSVVPSLWLLSLSRQSIIYQNLSVLDIVEKVFKRHGHSDFEIRCTRSYHARDYCVQYRETDLNFISRLLEEEGIFYYFEHADSKHVMVIADNNDSLEPCPGPEDPVRFMADEDYQEEDVVKELEHEHSLHTGKYTLWDYCFETPTNKLEASLSGDGTEEIYEYPGGFSERDDGERLVRLRLEAQEIEGRTLSGKGNCRHFVSGHTFILSEHFNDAVNGEYVLTQVQHFARAGGYRSWESNASLDYYNNFESIPIGVPFRPPMVTEKPTIHGSQTALVVGPPGEEVYVDKYGRVKVHFHWDRLDKKDQDSSCWIRVGTIWAGKGWGSVSIPRIGNEVIVAFEEGDPDKPLIIGSVFNADQTTPFELPGAGIQMGMKSRSSPGGGGNNEITMTDTKGEEKMTIHAQYNKDTTVENDDTTTIHNNRSMTIDVDDTTNVGVNQVLEVGADQTITVHGNQTETVDGNSDATVSGNRSTSVTGTEELQVSGSRTVDVTGDDSQGSSANQKFEAGANSELKAGGNVTLDAGGNMQINAGGSVLITAGSAITLSVGGSTVNVTGGSIDIVSSGMVTVMGALVKVN